MKSLKKHLVVLLFIAGMIAACENILSPSVDQNKPTETAVQNISDLEAVIYGVYDNLNEVYLFGRDFYVSGEVMSDNAWSNANSGRFIEQDQFNFTTSSYYALTVWETFYKAIAGTNIAIHADLESGQEVNHYKGQAYALRAFSHFNLLMAFGQQYVEGGNSAKGVPYMLQYNTAQEADDADFTPARETFQTVINYIEADLEKAVNLMDPVQFNPIELNYWAARALQTRFYLYINQYELIIPIAEEIINSEKFQVISMNELLSEWESGSGPEPLFELAFTETDRLKFDNIARIYRATRYGDIEASDDLYYSHRDDDIRLSLYSSDDESHRMVSKYSDELGTDHVRILRYAEVILNYAEALTQVNGGQISSAEALNMLANKRYKEGSPYGTTVTRDEVLAERRLELAMEGHRFYDLVRTGRDIPVGDASSARKEPIEFGSYKLALPIPESEIRANSNMEQNKGY